MRCVDWREEAHIRARTLHMRTLNAIAPEGDALMVYWNASGPTYDSSAMLSHEAPGTSLTPGFFVRWYGFHTAQETGARRWYATLGEALEAVRARYSTVEAAWRLGA